VRDRLDASAALRSRVYEWGRHIDAVNKVHVLKVDSRLTKASKNNGTGDSQGKDPAYWSYFTHMIERAGKVESQGLLR
jgi:hypothetical protein